ncbi:MAG: DUF3604 domain-containing protein [Myxococcales bacterium]|nr:DUF3604 domain-containing protein [Myxococcales bacterium]
MRRSPRFLLLCLFGLLAWTACTSAPSGPHQTPTVKTVDPLSGVAGELDEAVYQVEAIAGPVPKDSRLILRLPGAEYPDNFRAMIPTVRAALDGLDLPVGAGDARGECPSPSRSRYEVPISLPQGLPQGGRVIISVNKYRLPLRAVAQLPVSLAIGWGKSTTTEPLALFAEPVRAGAAVAVLADVPSTADPTEKIKLRVTGVDRYGNAAVPVNREFRLESEPQDLDLPDVTIDEQGQATIELRPLPAGVYRFSLIQNDQRWGRAGPCLVTDRPAAKKMLWGDPHSHTGYSDAYTTAGPRDAWAYARDAAHLDFAAVTDHAEPIWSCGLRPETEWAAIRQAAREANQPGSFTAFLGFEWTGSFPFQPGWPAHDGHANVLFPGDDGELCRADRPDCDTFLKLADRLTPLGALTIRHHTIVAWGAAAAPRMPVATLPVVEIFSSHGSSECLDCPRAIPEHVTDAGYAVQDYLLAGLRLGLIGGTDNHQARPGSRPFPGHVDLAMDAGGLTCAVADENTREGIFAALRARSAYATTGARIWLDFSLGATPLGQLAPAGAAPDLRFTVHAVEPLARVEILRGDLDAKKITVPFKLESAEYDLAGQWRDPQPVRHAFYYLRVTQSDGQMAWSSPIWLDR